MFGSSEVGYVQYQTVDDSLISLSLRQNQTVTWKMIFLYLSRSSNKNRFDPWTGRWKTGKEKKVMEAQKNRWSGLWFNWHTSNYRAPCPIIVN